MICVIFSFCVILFFPFCFYYIIIWFACHLLVACCLWLVAWGLKPFLVTLVQPIEKFLAAFHIGRWKRPMIISEPGQQVVVFNSLAHTSSPARPDPVYGTRAIGRCNVRTVSKRSALEI